jgi:hypothetical protein
MPPAPWWSARALLLFEPLLFSNDYRLYYGRIAAIYGGNPYVQTLLITRATVVELRRPAMGRYAGGTAWPAAVGPDVEVLRTRRSRRPTGTRYRTSLATCAVIV